MKKKIITISIYAVCLLLVGAIVTMSLVKVNALPEFEDPDWIRVYSSSQSSARNISKGNEDYNEILESIDEAFTQRYIQALFNGGLGQDYDINAGALKSTKPYIILKYSAFQKLVIGGENQKDPTSAQDIEYNEMYILLSETNERQPMLLQYRNSSNGSVWYFTCEGNSYSIYEAINK